MAYEIGFVDNLGTEGLAHWQMLLKIKTFAEANGWTTLRYLNPTDGTNRELIMQGVGLSGTEEIFIGFRSYHLVTADYYNLSVAGFTGYVEGNTFITQPGYFESGIPAHNQRIDYWLVANAQRVAFGMKVGTPVYESGYVGYFFPYATPSQYPYPLVVAGMLSGTPATRFSDTGHIIPYRSSSANMKLRFVDGTWVQPDGYPWNNGWAITLRDLEGQYNLIPVQLGTIDNLYGQLDGIFYVSGFNNVVENTLVIDGDTYIVLQDVYRTGFSDYYALRLS